jgi:L-fuconolactonase
VQTWNDLGETRDYLRIADETDFVAGIVGWVDLTDPQNRPHARRTQGEPLWQMAGGDSPPRSG